MKLNYFKSKLFIKYILSYLFMLLVPLVLLSVIIYNSAVSDLRSEIEQSHFNQLFQAKTIIDSHMKQLSDTASQVAYDEQLAKYRVHDPYYSLEAITALKKYKATSPIVSEMFLFFHDDENIYSSIGMTSLNVFNNKYIFKGWKPDEIVTDLNSVKYPIVRPTTLIGRNPTTTGTEPVLAYLEPITPNNPNPYGTIMYLIRESELTGLIDSIIGNYQGSSYIFDNKGQVMASNSNQEEPLDSGTLRSLFDLSTGIHSVKLNGEPHSVVSVKSYRNGWDYVTLMPSSQFLSNVLHIRNLMLLMFSIVAVCGAAVAILLARKQFHPIIDLVEFANSKSKVGGLRVEPHTAGDELARIRTALQEYSSRADLQEPYARNQFLLMLLKYGNALSISKELQGSFDIRFDKAYHFAMMIGRDSVPENHLDAHDWQTMIEQLAKVEFPDLAASVYGVELPKPSQMALIVNFDLLEGMSELGQYHGIVQKVHDNIVGLFRLDPVIGVGTCYSDPDQLNQSFIEACSAFESRMFSGHGSITFFENLTSTPGETLWVPSSLLLKLSQSLKQGSYEVAAQTISEGMNYFQNPDLSVKLKRCVYFDILNTMLKTGLELGIDNLAADISMYDASNSLEELKQHFLSLASRLCAIVERKEKTEEHSLIEQVITYIDSHYMDHSLSLEMVACKYSISVSYFSRFFKEQMGINFVQYIWQKRMNAVINELVTTNDPLKDIIQRVGYLDTPNFIRKFKKETGLTPGQYRKLYSQAEGADVSEDLTHSEL